MQMLKVTERPVLLAGFMVVVSFALLAGCSPSTDQHENAGKATEAWQDDFASFAKDLCNKRGTIPTRETLGAKSDIRIVTDGAGGVVDLSPTADSLQYKVNQDYSGKHVSWEITLAQDAHDTNLGGRVGLLPQQGVTDSAQSQIEEEATVLWIELRESDLPRNLSCRKGDVLLVEGTIGDASRTSLRGFFGVNAAYHLESDSQGADRTAFIVGLEDVMVRARTSKSGKTPVKGGTK